MSSELPVADIVYSDPMNGSARELNPDLIAHLIDTGAKLKQQALGLIASWQFDTNRGMFPSFITGETHLLGDLEIFIERWFNEIDVLTRESLAYDKQSLWDALHDIVRPFGRSLRHFIKAGREEPTRDEVLSYVAEDFDVGIRALQGLPRLPKNVISEQGSFRLQPNSAFILMWMSRKQPELEDVANCLKEVFDEFDVQATRADDIEHQDVITDVILRHIRESEFLVADLTGERPNVYYEVGYAHAIGKRPILYRRQGTPLHFDLSVHNVPEYSNITELKTLLRKRLEAMTGKQPRKA
jgi:hypothetical protein